MSTTNILGSLLHNLFRTADYQYRIRSSFSCQFSRMVTLHPLRISKSTSKLTQIILFALTFSRACWLLAAICSRGMNSKNTASNEGHRYCLQRKLFTDLMFAAGRSSAPDANALTVAPSLQHPFLFASRSFALMPSMQKFFLHSGLMRRLFNFRQCPI
jgi:hypothetical protein